jgi:hypothetical protein
MTIPYVSYDGALEPLGESQVVAYLERLSRRHALTLLSFEKDADLKDAARVGAPAHRLAAAGVMARRGERRLFESADAVVSLTAVGVEAGRRPRTHDGAAAGVTTMGPP